MSINKKTGKPEAEISLRHHYNGSGPKAFGGARQWPVVKLELAFNEGEHAKAEKWFNQLSRFLKAQGFETSEGERANDWPNT